MPENNDDESSAFGWILIAASVGIVVVFAFRSCAYGILQGPDTSPETHMPNVNTNQDKSEERRKHKIEPEFCTHTSPHNLTIAGIRCGLQTHAPARWAAPF